jgi:hypothetical protein
MISAVGIVPIPLYLLRWNKNVLPVFPALCIDFSVNVLDFGGVAVRIIATAEGWIIGPVPR